MLVATFSLVGIIDNIEKTRKRLVTYGQRSQSDRFVRVVEDRAVDPQGERAVARGLIFLVVKDCPANVTSFHQTYPFMLDYTDFRDGVAFEVVRFSRVSMCLSLTPSMSCFCPSFANSSNLCSPGFR